MVDKKSPNKERSLPQSFSTTNSFNEVIEEFAANEYSISKSQFIIFLVIEKINYFIKKNKLNNTEKEYYKKAIDKLLRDIKNKIFVNFIRKEIFKESTDEK